MTESLFAFGADNTLSVVEPLTQKENAAIAKARTALHQFQAGEQLFEIYSANVQAFRAFAAQTLESFSKDQSMSGTRMQRIATLANCHLLNVLSSLRTFLDHADTRLKRQFGKGSKVVAAFEVAKSREYDRQFAYRFFYRLRNYAQHCGLPIAHITLGSKAMGEVGPNLDPPTREVVRMEFDAKRLREDFDGWGPQVAQELMRMSRPLEASALLGRHEKSVLRIHKSLRKVTVSACRPEAKRLRAFMERVRRVKPDAVPCVGHVTGSRDGSKARFRLWWFPVRTMRDLLPSDGYLTRFEG